MLVHHLCLARCLVLLGERSGISSLRIDSGNRKRDAATRFRNDPDILVLLLHGYVQNLPHAGRSRVTDGQNLRERQNAGLNVTCASRVFLLESVVHHSFEIQGWLSEMLSVPSINFLTRLCTVAIARIDRLGQLRPTEGMSFENPREVYLSVLSVLLLR